MSREEEKKKIEARIATEACHWYDHDGEPVHEVPKKSGKPGEMRPTTKADAKKLNLIPSVTNLLGRYDSKPGLDDWKRNKIFEMLNPTNMRIMAQALDEGKTDIFDEYCKKIDEDARAEAARAADLGTKFHYAMELLSECFNDHGWQGQAKYLGVLNGTPTFKEMRQLKVAAIRVWEFLHETGAIGISNVTTKHLSEGSVSFNLTGIAPKLMNKYRDGAFGLGGKIDLIVTYKGPHSVPEPILEGLPTDEANAIINRLKKGYEVRALFDFKTRKPNRLKSGAVTFPAYPSDIAQIAGYRAGVMQHLGFGIDFCGNIMVPSDILDDGAPDGWRASEPLQMRLYGERAIAAGMQHLRSCAEIWVADETLDAIRKSKGGEDPSDMGFVPFIPDDAI